MNIGIAAIEYYLPETRLGNHELVEEAGFDESFLRDKLGIEERRIASRDEATSDMSEKAAKRVLESCSLEPKDIGLLILCTQNPDFKLPGTSHIVQDRLGLPVSCAAFDVGLGCSGFVYGLAIAKAFMLFHGIKHGLLLTCDPYSKIISKDDRNTRPLFGDAASAALLSDGASCKILEFTFGSDGSGFHHLIVEGGGTRNPLSGENTSISNCLYMNGRQIFNFMMRRVPSDVSNCLEKNHLTVEDIDRFVFHQASKYMLENLAKRLELPAEKMVYCLRETGNTVSSSIPIALSEMFREGGVTQKRVLISGFGVGLSWASTVLHFI